MWLRKKTYGNAPGYSWAADGDVVEVEDALALELLERADGEFTEVPEGEVPKATLKAKADAEKEAAKATEVPKATTRTKISE